MPKEAAKRNKNKGTPKEKSPKGSKRVYKKLE